VESQLTLDQLAERVGLSSPYLSRIETGGRRPSVTTLYDLAAALGVSVSTLFQEPSPLSSVGIFRRRERVAGRSPATGFPGSTSLDGVFVELAAHREDDSFVSHSGEEFIYVVKGSVVLQVGESSSVLKAGDTAHWDGSRAHRLGGAGKPADVLLLCSERLRAHPPKEGTHGHHGG
jgi:transcriptional regulator with XRE-family HTH domain